MSPVVRESPGPGLELSSLRISVSRLGLANPSHSITLGGADGARGERVRPRPIAHVWASNPRELDAKDTAWDADFMTQATQKLIEEFEGLPDRDRSELVAELARRVAVAPHDLPNDGDLVAMADNLFADLDRREQPE